MGEHHPGGLARQAGQHLSGTRWQGVDIVEQDRHGGSGRGRDQILPGDHGDTGVAIVPGDRGQRRRLPVAGRTGQDRADGARWCGGDAGQQFAQLRRQ
ncbi:hypothetical protein CVV72_21255 [Amycolatopsis sp. TNS106]|nr:hypothetical protein CVV72_21255 [Amycolatopsis sp. TNS106]